MKFPTDPVRHPSSKQGATRQMVFLSLLVAISIVLSYFERVIPLPWAIPGMKLGLANVITLSAFYYFNKKDVGMLVMIRIVLTALIIGSVTSFFYSLSGGILSFMGMAVLHQFFNKKMSTIGISIIGAVLHNIGQLLVLGIMTQSISVPLSYGPLIMIAGVLTGISVGVISKVFMTHLNKAYLKR